MWNGVAVDRPTLEARLADAAAQAEQPEIHIRPNKLVEYKYVAGVMASAQRLGATKLGMVGNEQFAK
jgi:biopolymer transport protein ExbD